MFGYFDLMQEAFSAHENFKDEWKKWKSGKSKKVKKNNGRIEPESVTKARENFFQKHGLLFESKIEPLKRNFLFDPQSVLDELIEFLTTDITAFRCGYAKEFFLRRLKNVEMPAREIEKLRQAAIEICRAENIRREFHYWCRLMIKLADEDFVLELKKLLSSENDYVRLKSKLMLEVIEKHRADLKLGSKKKDEN